MIFKPEAIQNNEIRANSRQKSYSNMIKNLRNSTSQQSYRNLKVSNRSDLNRNRANIVSRQYTSRKLFPNGKNSNKDLENLYTNASDINAFQNETKNIGSKSMSIFTQRKQTYCSKDFYSDLIDESRYITDAVENENDKITKQHQLFNQKMMQIGEDIDYSAVQKEQDEIYKTFQQVDTQIRDLNWNLRRIFKASNDEPYEIRTDVWNTFGAIAKEVIYFKVNCQDQKPPLKIVIKKKSIEWILYLSTKELKPNSENNDRKLNGVQWWYYYPSQNSQSFDSNLIYLAVECLQEGTVDMLLKYQDKRFYSNLTKHTKSSAALITTKFSDKNWKLEYK